MHTYIRPYTHDAGDSPVAIPGLPGASENKIDEMGFGDGSVWTCFGEGFFSEI